MKKIFLLTIALFTAFYSFSQNGNSLLWKIKGNGLEKPSYLYGTIHVICPDDFTMDESVKKAFRETDQVYLEIDFDNPGMMAEMQQIIMIDDEKSPSDFLNETDYETLNNFMKSELGMGLEMVGKMKPFALMSMMIIPMVGCQPKSFESEFVQMASSAGKEILGLETATYQMEIFDSIPYDKQYQMLVEMVNEKDSAIAEFKEMVEAYKQNDVVKLGILINESDWEYKGYENILIYNRNKNWVPIIKKVVTEKPTFIAVGAGHLPRNEGLISLLKNEGFEVIPVY